MFDFELYNDIRLRTATAPAANSDSVVVFEYEVRRRPWLNHIDWGFEESIPVHEAHIVLHLPQGWEYRASWAGISPVTPTQSTGSDAEWILHDLPAIKHEPMSPPFWALSGRLGLSYLEPGQSNRNASSWEALGRWYDQLTMGRRNPVPELSEKAHQLTVGKTDFDGKVRALASFLQSDIRYVAIEIGGGWISATPGARRVPGALRRLQRQGNAAEQHVARSGRRVRLRDRQHVSRNGAPGCTLTRFQSYDSGHRSATGANTDSYRTLVTSKSGKRYLIFDPTDPYTPLGELRGQLQDTNALLVAGGRGELIHTPLLEPDTNTLVRRGLFTLSADGTLAGEIVEDRSGDHAWQERIALNHANQQERAQQIEKRISRSLNGFTLEKADIQHLDQIQQKLVISLKLSNPGYGQVRGPLMLVRPRVLGEKSFALERKPRQYPFQFERTSRETDSFEIELPKEYAVEDVPDPVKMDAGFASYQSKIEVEGSKVRYSREFVQRDVLIGPEHTEELRKFLGTIGADEAAVVVLQRAP